MKEYCISKVRPPLLHFASAVTERNDIGRKCLRTAVVIRDLLCLSCSSVYHSNLHLTNRNLPLHSLVTAWMWPAGRPQIGTRQASPETEGLTGGTPAVMKGAEKQIRQQRSFPLFTREVSTSEPLASDTRSFNRGSFYWDSNGSATDSKSVALPKQLSPICSECIGLHFGAFAAIKKTKAVATGSDDMKLLFMKSASQIHCRRIAQMGKTVVKDRDFPSSCLKRKRRIKRNFIKKLTFETPL
ncbi:hypothetical protein CDAR_410861 [Caerostris darwini]|uniref:Uncharacterized protein n=1 Tax=Caerostris darwini TaxID=1538125 RepID=A0AAV4SFK5_9ARAC|nr:hypothetical protein CDAR_410861 [Caerostris darwini]